MDYAATESVRMKAFSSDTQTRRLPISVREFDHTAFHRTGREFPLHRDSFRIDTGFQLPVGQFPYAHPYTLLRCKPCVPGPYLRHSASLITRMAFLRSSSVNPAFIWIRQLPYSMVNSGLEDCPSRGQKPFSLLL